MDDSRVCHQHGRSHYDSLTRPRFGGTKPVCLLTSSRTSLMESSAYLLMRGRYIDMYPSQAGLVATIA